MMDYLEEGEVKCPLCSYITTKNQCERCGNQLGPEEKTLIFEDTNLRGGFTQIPNDVLRDGKLSTTARLLYALLLSHAWGDNECFPGQDTLAEELGTVRRTVIRTLSELKDAGLISWHRRGQGRVNIYTIRTLSVAYPKRKYSTRQKEAMALRTVLEHPTVAHKAELLMGNRVINEDGENVNWQVG